jgi:hypothetical protein
VILAIVAFLFGCESNMEMTDLAHTTYDLVAVNGREVPVTIDQTQYSEIKILSGTIQFGSNGTFQGVSRVAVIEGDAYRESEHEHRGRYVVERDTVRVVTEDGSETIYAMLDDGAALQLLSGSSYQVSMGLLLEYKFHIR